jgi:hypothetical protein
MGFRPNRSTIDNIVFMVRQIYEKCHRYNTDLHNIFIDFSQAFDTVNTDVIYNSLTKHSVPDKLIKLIKLTMQKTIMKVKVNNSYSEWFEMETGVRQGYHYLLYCLVLCWIQSSPI